jgi:hypothetical protein
MKIQNCLKIEKLLSFVKNINVNIFMQMHSSVGIATSYGLDDRGVGVRVLVGSRIFSSPRRTDRLWGPPSLLSNGYGGKMAGT